MCIYIYIYSVNNKYNTIIYFYMHASGPPGVKHTNMFLVALKKVVQLTRALAPALGIHQRGVQSERGAVDWGSII